MKHHEVRRNCVTKTFVICTQPNVITTSTTTAQLPVLPPLLKQLEREDDHSLLSNTDVINAKEFMPWLRRLVAGVSPRRAGFDPKPVHVGFVVDKVAVEQIFYPYFLVNLYLHRGA
jgi:hypothetical protein